MIIMLTLALVMGLRFNVGVDYPVYAEIYDNPLSINRYALEPTWIWICDGLNHFGFRSRVFFFLTSMLIISGYYVGMKKFSTDIYLSFIIFIGCSFYYETSNTVRQCCAQAVLFASTVPLLSGSWKKFAACALCAMMLHVSAIAGILLMILSRFTYKTWLVWGVFLISVGCGGMLSRIFENNIMVLTTSSYTSESFSDGVSSGLLKYVYNLVGVAFLLLYPRLRKVAPRAVFFFNMTLLGICIYNVFYSFMVMRRLAQYCLPYLVIMLPMTGVFFQNKSRALFIGSIVLILMAFAFKQVLNTPYNFDLNFF